MAKKPTLIGIDGPDGTGKSTFSEYFALYLMKKFGKSEVVLIKPTYFSTSKQAEEVEKKMILSQEEKYSPSHNLYYLEAMMLNYKHVVIPALKKKKIVLLDSTELRALAFNMSKACDKAVDDVVLWIKSNKLTLGIFPDVRILLSGSDEDIWKNLNTKKNLDAGDPNTLEKVKERKEYYKCALEKLEKLQACCKTRNLLVNILHTSHPKKQFNEIAKILLEKIF